MPADGDPGQPFSSWTGATSILIGLLAVASGAYTAAIFLAGDAMRAGMADLAAAFRRRALGAAIVAGGLAIGGLAVVSSDAPDLYDGLTSSELSPIVFEVAGAMLAVSPDSLAGRLAG